ncbi:MAG: hypothetical protein GY760_17005 [Deltaproteobacteria bacterium]|nr:hypothetical protein [Deltaproteobacteria bacterium]
MSNMDKVISNLKTILDDERLKSDSPLSDIKRIYYGDPINIDEHNLPAIIINFPQWNYQQSLHCTLFIIIAYSQSTYLSDNPTDVVNTVKNIVIQSEAIRDILKRNPNLAINNDPLTSACDLSKITSIKPSYNSERDPYTFELVLTFEATVKI